MTDNKEQSGDFTNLDPKVKQKALEIAATLNKEDIPEGSTKLQEAVRRAREWFINLEG
ncbi:hypothetical protein [Mucilaginibacter pedocola]|uniref:hypothetical protein n=1 Tax=Mucilaginibacter pedocola TaxID=1792845 RepID=UPI0012DF2364|nr:hypothetical protein [Mucilaginibacter pedocola]